MIINLIAFKWGGLYMRSDHFEVTNAFSLEYQQLAMIIVINVNLIGSHQNDFTEGS